MKDTNETQTAQNTKAVLLTEIPYPSKKTEQTGSVARDSLTPFRWDHIAGRLRGAAGRKHTGMLQQMQSRRFLRHKQGQ